MVKLLVEIPVYGSAKELMEDMENNREKWFVGNTSVLKLNESYINKSDEGEYLFILKGVIDDEEPDK